MLLLDRLNVSPPAGAGALMLKVAVEDTPPTTLLGDKTRAAVDPSTVTCLGIETAPREAVIVTTVSVSRAVVVVVNCTVAVVAPAGTTTVAGTEITDGLLLARLTTVPPDPAGTLMVIVPVAFSPTATVVGLIVKSSRLAASMKSVPCAVLSDHVPCAGRVAVILRCVFTGSNTVWTVKVFSVSPALNVSVVGLIT
jgi:hypothetical protein